MHDLHVTFIYLNNNYGVTAGDAVSVGITISLVEVMVGVKVGVTVEETTVKVAVIPVCVAEAVPDVPDVMTTVNMVPNGWDLSLDNLHVPVVFPAVAGAVNATEISTDSPGFTALPMAVAFPLIPSPAMKMI